MHFGVDLVCESTIGKEMITSVWFYRSRGIRDAYEAMKRPLAKKIGSIHGVITVLIEIASPTLCTYECS